MPYLFDNVTDAAIEGAIISRVGTSAAAPSRGDADDYWYGPISSPSATGLNVTADSAMRLSAVYRCVSILGSTLGSLPLKIYKSLDDGGKEEAEDHPLYELLHDAPNGWQTAMEFIEMMEGPYRALRGNAIAQILPGPRGAIDQLIPIHPDRVTISRLSNGRIGYAVAMPDGTRKNLTQDEVFHVRGMSLDGIRGLNPIEHQRETLGVGLAGQMFAARFFANDATPGGVLEHPASLKENGAANLKRSWRDAHGGVMNAHSIVVLEEGMKYHQVGISNRDAQFIETQRYSLGDIARMFGVPMHMINELDRATFSNIEQQSLEFVRDTIRPNCERWEAVIQRDLIKPLEPVTGPGYYAEFNLDALLRADFKTRMEGYAIQIQNHLASPDECRAHENMNPIPDGSGAEFYHAVNIESDSQTAAKAATAATQAASGPSPRSAQPPPDSADDGGADAAIDLVTIKVKRELALALNGNAHWEQAA